MDWLVIPIDYFIGMFDVVDLVVICLIAIFGIVYYYKSRSTLPKSVSTLGTITPNTSISSRTDRSFLGRMKSEERQVIYIFCTL
jgi:hypothetical protein